MIIKLVAGNGFTEASLAAAKISVKIMIEDGQMPSSNPKLNDFDFDWEVDWDTEISKTQFAKISIEQV